MNKPEDMRIESIPTRYDGHDFRSRTEARWAVIWKYTKTEYEYEPGYFDLGYGIRYQPDFLLHGVKGIINGDLYVEVKGVLTEKDAYKIEKCPAPILMVGSIPNPSNFYNDMIQKYDETYGIMYSCENINGDIRPAIVGVTSNNELWIDSYEYIDSIISDKMTSDAFRTARMACFEQNKNESEVIASGTNS